MNLKNKNVLVMGMGISGVSIVKALDTLGANISINDIKTKNELKESLEGIEGVQFTSYLGGEYPNLENIDLILKSPGIKPGNEILVDARKRNIKITNDIEIGSETSDSNNIIAVTGTNGKTTTTTIVSEILRNNRFNTYTGGNIGKSILLDMLKSKKEDVFLLETSSFQLEDTINFKPKISLILNITEDHLDWHGSFNNYLEAKKKVFKNQTQEDYTILNYDDKILRSFQEEIKSNIVWFSLESKLRRGIFIKNGNIIINLEGEEVNFLSTDKLLLKGKHNLENILASIAVSILMEVPLNNIKETIINFKGVEHRLEFVGEKAGRKFYNDSKGTNIMSSLKAIGAIDGPITLIAGGYDKGIEFDEYIKGFNGKVETMILLGQTSNKLYKTAKKYNFNDVFLVESIDEAVNLAFNISETGSSILLSPACASWGMFKNFEERGKLFKDKVHSLGDV